MISGCNHLQNLSNLRHLELCLTTLDCRLLSHLPASLKRLEINGVYSNADSLDRSKIRVARFDIEEEKHQFTFEDFYLSDTLIN
jgi:hypothetical protein